MNQARQWTCSIAILFFSLYVATSLLGQTATAGGKPLQINDVKLCREVDENRKPIGVTSEFSAETRNIHAWFSWKNGYAGLQITARWHYVSEDIHILDFPVTLTRRSDVGVVSLQMPSGKKFPSGSYRIDFDHEGSIIQSATFNVLSAPQT